MGGRGEEREGDRERREREGERERREGEGERIRKGKQERGERG